MKQRLQKIIAEAGVASRRAAEGMILSGRVRVNGEPAGLGDSADAVTDKISIDGKPLRFSSKMVYIMLNKPRGYVTTLKDEKGRKCVIDLLDGVKERVFPIGRLDLDSEGLLLLTNDGELAYKLCHPSYGINKSYHVSVRGNGINDAISMMSREMTIDGNLLRPAKVRIIRQKEDSALLEVTISEGKNRQIRKMCGEAGLCVLRLERVRHGELTLGNLSSGKWRRLNDRETAYLQRVKRFQI